MKTIIDRFWEKVDRREETECWNWMAHKVKNYGLLKFGKTHVFAHRYSWTIHFGNIPSGLKVCHTCDNPSCVNPKHLFLGTQTDNMKDMVRKGRTRLIAGEKNGSAKLTNADAIAIREKYSTGDYSLRSIAKEYNVGHRAIWEIVNLKSFINS